MTLASRWNCSPGIRVQGSEGPKVPGFGVEELLNVLEILPGAGMFTHELVDAPFEVQRELIGRELIDLCDGHAAKPATNMPGRFR